MAQATLNWAAINADPRFRRLHRRKAALLAWLMGFSIVYYFLLPVGAAYFPELFRIRLFGAVNLGIVFALSEFLVAWGVAGLYSARARRFDALAMELIRDAERVTSR